MCKHLGWTSWAALFLSAGLAAPQARGGDKIHVLIIDGQNNHTWKATTPVMKKALEDCGRFVVDVATAPERVTLPAKPTEPREPKAPDSKDEKVLKKY